MNQTIHGDDILRKMRVKRRVWAITTLVALVVFYLLYNYVFSSIPDEDSEAFIGLGALMAVSVFLITPNIIIYAINDARKMQGINHGSTLPQDKMSGFYSIYTSPVDFKRKLIRTILRNQLLSAVVVIAIVLLLLYASSDSLDPDLSRVSGAPGMFILGVLLFGIPALSYFTTNLVIRIRTIIRNEYEAYHAVVERVDINSMSIVCDEQAYKFKYPVCVGKRGKKIHDTPAILVFLLDEVYIIPDDVNGLSVE